MKKLLTMALILMLVANLTACGGDKQMFTVNDYCMYTLELIEDYLDDESQQATVLSNIEENMYRIAELEGNECQEYLLVSDVYTSLTSGVRSEVVSAAVCLAEFIWEDDIITLAEYPEGSNLTYSWQIEFCKKLVSEQCKTIDIRNYSFMEMICMDVECESAGTFWASATLAGDDVGYYYVAFDANQNIICSIPSDSTKILSCFYEGLAAISINGESKIINNEGVDITPNYLDSENEVFLDLCGDSTGITIWTAEDVETYASYDTILRAKSVDGTIKQTWSLASNNETYEDYQLNLFYHSAAELLTGAAKGNIEYIGEGFYCIYKESDSYHGSYPAFIFDLNSGNVKDVGISYGYSPINDKMVVCTDPSTNSYDGHVEFVCYNISIGEIAWKIISYASSVYDMQRFDYNYGFGFSMGKLEDGEKYAGFFDKDGHLAIDLLKTIPALSGRETYVVDACMLEGTQYGIISLANETGKEFVVLIDQEGNMLFEPVRGYHRSGKLSLSVYSRLPVILGENGKLYLLETDGRMTVLSDGMQFAQYYAGNYYYIDNGQIVTSDL